MRTDLLGMNIIILQQAELALWDFMEFSLLENQVSLPIPLLEKLSFNISAELVL